MKQFKKPLAMLLAAAFVGASMMGCSQQPSETETPLTKVTVSEVTHSVFYAPQYAAINLGFFEEEGIEIELSNGQGADKVMSAVLSGHIDIGFAGPEAAIYVVNEGRENHPQVFAQLTQRDGSFLVGRQPEPDFDWSQLEGKTILPGRKGGVPYMALEYVVKSKGLTPGEDVIFDDSIKFEAMTGAFTAGTGDYVTMFEPTASMIEAEGKGYIVASVGEEAGEIPYTAYFASNELIEKDPALIQHFTNAIYKGQQWVATHTPEEIAQAIAPSFPDTDEALLATVARRYQEIGAWSTDPIMKESSFDLLQTVMTSAGELDQKASYDKVVNNSFAKAAVEALGK